MDYGGGGGGGGGVCALKVSFFSFASAHASVVNFMSRPPINQKKKCM
jgi:hypothetical protein